MMANSGFTRFSALRAFTKRFFLFGVSGGMGFLVDLGVLTAFVAMGTGEIIGRVPAILAATGATFVLNQRLAFKDRAPDKPLIQAYLHYLALSWLGVLINACAYIVALQWLHLHYAIALVLATATSMFVNFATYSRFVFKKRDS